jgi:antitoxin component of MazEF toxin-antitoxin module
MKVAFQKWGNGLALRVPKAFADEIGASNGKVASLIREPQDKRQGSTEPSHILIAETPNLLSDPFASDSDRLIGHHLRCEPQSIFGAGINSDAKIRSVHQFGRQLADHH